MAKSNYRVVITYIRAPYFDSHKFNERAESITHNFTDEKLCRAGYVELLYTSTKLLSIGKVISVEMILDNEVIEKITLKKIGAYHSS